MKKFLSAIAFGLMALSLSAQEDAHWIRKSDISPDGTTLAFSYQGDIFTVPVTGGTAHQVTTNPSYDSDPLWTADGKDIVFSSYREGSKDIWTIPAAGGKARRLTTFPGQETPLFVSRNGLVYYSANIQADPAYGNFPGDPQLYTVNIKDGRSTLVTSIPMMNVSVNTNGIIIYEDYKGYEDGLRKHHTSSVTRDIWKYLPKKNQYQKLSRFLGENRNPVFAQDGQTYYYLSEQSGTFNVWKSNINTPEEATQVTALTTHPVRNLSISANGKLAFSYNGDLYTCTPGEKPVKVNIQVVTDKVDKDVIHRNISRGASDIAVSPNGKEIALVAHGDVFVVAPDQKTTKRITNTPSQERGVSFSSDGRTLYYAAERDGHWGIWKTELSDKDDKYFTFSYKTQESLFSKAGQTCFQPKVSPDGKWVAFLRDRTELVIKGTAKGEEKSLLKDANYSYADGDQSFEWSPDSHHILVNYQADGGWNNTDIAIVNIDSGKVTDLTQSGYSDGSFHWAMNGKAMLWETDRMGYRSHGSWGAHEDIFMMFFDTKEYYDFTRSKEEESMIKLLSQEDKKAADKDKKDSTKVKKVKALELQLEGRDERIVRLTPVSGVLGDYFLTDDGKTLYFFRQLESGIDFCSMDVKEGNISIVRKSFNARIYPSADHKTLYLRSGNGISKMNVGSSKIESISFASDYDYQPAKEREYIYDHVCKQVSEKFYDKAIHNIDWDGYCRNYRAFLPYITNNFDFQDLLSELLGELNASHTGARYYYRPSDRVTTGYIGVLFDPNYKGAGLKIAEILPGSEISMANPDIKAGDVISAIDGEEIKEGTMWYDAFRYKAGKRIFLNITKTTKGRLSYTEVYVNARYTDYDLLYKRWVKQREEMTEKLSGGRVGYVHVEGMDSNSFREVYSKALGKYRNCEALIVDTRHNGGGWLHDDLATFLNGKAYAEFRPRGQYIGTEPFSKWTKPSCVLVGEDNYSDACGFPYVYKSFGIGKLIGAPVPGTMTAVWWETQIDPTIVFGIPQVTCWGLKENRPIENLQIEPDILVYNTAESLLKGEDLQLEAAVKEMLSEIDANK